MALLPTLNPEKRIRKQIEHYIEVHRSERNGKINREEHGSFSVISLLSRIWLFFMFLVMGGLVFLFSSEWWVWLTIFPLGLYFLYQSTFGLRTDLKNHIDESGALETNEEAIEKALQEASTSIELSLGTANFLVLCTLAIAEALVAVLAAILSVFTIFSG